MPEVDFGIVACVIGLVNLALVLLRTRAPAPPKPVPAEEFDVDGLLGELHGMSRGTGMRVHIHDIESVVRRRCRRE